MQVAAALREGRAVEPENYDCVTIFFSDIVGFTNISGILQPQEVWLTCPRCFVHGFIRYGSRSSGTVGNQAMMHCVSVHVLQLNLDLARLSSKLATGQEHSMPLYLAVYTCVYTLSKGSTLTVHGPELAAHELLPTKDDTDQLFDCR